MKKVRYFDDLKRGVCYEHKNSWANYYFVQMRNKYLAIFVEVTEYENYVDYKTVYLNEREIKSLRYDL